MGLEQAKPAKTPGSSSSKPADTSELIGKELSNFRTCVGKLIYVKDEYHAASFAIKELTRSMQKPSVNDMECLRHCVRFLMGQLERGTLYSSRHSPEIVAFVDSDWAKCRKTRKSSDCVCLYVNSCVVHFSVKTQGLHAMSTAEAELAGIHRGAVNCVLLQNLLIEIGSSFLGEKTLKVYSDSSVARAIANRVGVGG